MSTKRFAIGMLIVGTALGFGMSAVAQNTVQDINAQINSGIKLNIHGSSVQLKEPDGTNIYPIVYNGRTYLPLRSLSELLNEDVKWDGPSQTISLIKKSSEDKEKDMVQEKESNATVEDDLNIILANKNYRKDIVPVITGSKVISKVIDAECNIVELSSSKSLKEVAKYYLDFYNSKEGKADITENSDDKEYLITGTKDGCDFQLTITKQENGTKTSIIINVNTD